MDHGSVRPLRVLCIDAEGGHGGSSRSLYQFVKHLDRVEVEPEVWCRRGGEIERLYANLGVRCECHPDIPKVASLRRLSRNIVVHASFWARWRESRPFRDLLRARASEFDVIHFNIESLSWLAADLRRTIATPITFHVRTRPYDSLFARAQARRIAQVSDAIVHITENERDNFQRLAGTAEKQSVIYNVVEPVPATTTSSSPPVAGLRVAVLSNFDYLRGIDRIVDVAVVLKQRGRSDITFIVAGDTKMSKALPGALGDIARAGGDIVDYARVSGVADLVQFLGHVHDPERVLMACDVLAKPTREDNPWGRDILEALAAGLPVVSCGTYDRFVKPGVSGVLLSRYSDQAFADALIELADAPSHRKAMGRAGRAVVGELCDGPSRAADLAAIWRRVAAPHTGSA